MSSSDSDNVIPSTPPQVLQKRMKISMKKSHNNKNEHNIEDYLIDSSSSCASLGNMKTSTSSKSYVYYSIEEILKLPQDILLTTKIHTIGLHRIKDDKHFLTVHWIKSDINISLNFKYLKITPQDNEIISVYGCFDKNSFVVKFYKLLSKEVVDKYIENLKILRQLI